MARLLLLLLVVSLTTADVRNAGSIIHTTLDTHSRYYSYHKRRSPSLYNIPSIYCAPVPLIDTCSSLHA